MPVKKWAPEVAVEFLLKRTGQTDAAAATRTRSARWTTCRSRLEQAAAYIDSGAKDAIGLSRDVSPASARRC